MSNLANTFTENATANADKTAIFWGDEQVTFGQAHRLAGGLAKRLKDEFGLQPGDRVGLWLKNCPEFVFSLFGILLAEGVVVSINNFLTPDEVGYILEDSGAKVLISEASMAEGTAALQSQLDGLAVIEVEELGQADDSQAPELPPAGQAGEDLALIIYTSGTTGKPKGAMLSNNNLLRNVGGVMEELELTPEDRMACLLPMFHSFSMTVCVLLPMTQGLSVVAVKSLHPPKNIIGELLLHQATVLPAIPQLYRMLANVQMPPGMALRGLRERRRAVAAGGAQGVQRERRHPAARGVRPQRDQPGRLLQPVARREKSRISRPADSRGGIPDMERRRRSVADRRAG